MKKFLIITLTFIVIAVLSLFVLDNLKYSNIEITAENFSDLAEIENIDVYNVYKYDLTDYPGFSGLDQMYFGHGEEIKRASRYIQSSTLTKTGYTFLGRDSNFEEKYRLDFIDWTSITTTNTRDRIKLIYQTISLSCCDGKYNILTPDGYNKCTFELNSIIGKRINLLQTKGFILKESSFKNQNSILVKEGTEYFLIIETNYEEGLYKPAFLRFKVYDKRKFSIL